METNFDIGVKYADKQHKQFDEEKMKAGQCVIGLQVIDTIPGTSWMFWHESFFWHEFQSLIIENWSLSWSFFYQNGIQGSFIVRFEPTIFRLQIQIKNSNSTNICHERDGVEDSNAEDRSFNNKVKQNKEQKPPRRGKTSRQAEDWGTVRHETLT